MLKGQIKKEEAKKRSEAKKELRIKKINDVKRRARIYKLLKEFVYHKDIKNFFKESFDINPKNHFLQNVSTLSQQLFNNGFEVPDNERYNDNLGNNFVLDLTIFRNKLPPITNTKPVEIINLSVEDKSIPAEQFEDAPLPEIPEELTLQETMNMYLVSQAMLIKI
jgi:hypothetical protein